MLLQIIETTLEKWKGPVLGKLIQLIEADSQLLMRILLVNRVKNKVENDKLIYAYDYRSRKGCSIEYYFLEQILILDYSEELKKRLRPLLKI